MGSIRPGSHETRTEAITRATLEKFGDAFCSRLHSERVQFVIMSALLARADDEHAHAPVFDELNGRAHRLRGLAAMFECPDLAAAARTLERACIVAAGCRDERTIETVWTALLALVQMLGEICGEAPGALTSAPCSTHRPAPRSAPHSLAADPKEP